MHVGARPKASLGVIETDQRAMGRAYARSNIVVFALACLHLPVLCFQGYHDWRTTGFEGTRCCCSVCMVVCVHGCLCLRVWACSRACVPNVYLSVSACVWCVCLNVALPLTSAAGGTVCEDSVTGADGMVKFALVICLRKHVRIRL